MAIQLARHPRVLGVRTVVASAIALALTNQAFAQDNASEE